MHFRFLTSLGMGLACALFSTESQAANKLTDKLTDKLCQLTPGSEVSTQLNACLKEGRRGDRILLPAGRFLIGKPIDVTEAVVLATSGVSKPCSLDENHGCAELEATPDFHPDPTVAILNVKADGAQLRSIVVNGAKSTRLQSQAAKECAAGNNARGYNIAIPASNVTVSGIVTKNALCATALWTQKGVRNFVLENSSIASNGVHNSHGMWADGATLIDLRDSRITGNFFFNNTDIDLIFGGCQNCLVENNVIQHDTSFAGSAFAGLMLHAWPNGASSGDFTGTIVRNNVIDCSAKKRCGFGIYLGSESWWDPLESTCRHASLSIL